MSALPAGDREGAVEWLLASPEPATAYLARRDLLGEAVEPDPELIVRGPKRATVCLLRDVVVSGEAMPVRSLRFERGQ